MNIYVTEVEQSQEELNYYGKQFTIEIETPVGIRRPYMGKNHTVDQDYVMRFLSELYHKQCIKKNI